MAAIAANILVNRNERCVPMSVKPLRFLLAAGAIALIPAAAATQAASEADTYQQLDQLMNAFEKVRSEYVDKVDDKTLITRSEEHTSELQSLMRRSYAVFCLQKNKTS